MKRNSKLKQSIKDLICFFSVDYSQLEIRILAEMSGDPLLRKQFQQKKDIHCLVGHTLTGWPTHKIARDKEVRRSIKEFHFSLVYGVGREQMYSHLRAKGVKITKVGANRYYDRYFRRYKGVQKFMERCRAQAESKGYVNTLFGFKRHVYQKDESRGSYWGNQAVNSPVQGTAHQLVLMALALIDMKPRTYRLLQTPVAEIHDELLFYTRFGDLLGTYTAAKQLLEQDVVDYAERHFKRRLQVPLQSEASIGFCRGSLVDYQGESLEQALENWRAKQREIEALPMNKLLPKRSLV